MRRDVGPGETTCLDQAESSRPGAGLVSRPRKHDHSSLHVKEVSRIAKQKQGKKGGKKIGRNATSCQNYRNRNQRERNKAIRLRKHLKRFENDGCAKAALTRCYDAIRGFKAAA